MRLRGAASAKGRWQPFVKLVVWLQTALMALVVSGLGATPALAIQPVIVAEGNPDVTDNVWLKLACNVTLQIGGAVAVAHIGVILRATHPETVDPGQVFDMTNVTAVQVLPPTAQHVALATYAPDNFAGTINDFELNGTNASANFVPGSSSPTQLNQVGALQPANSDAPNPTDNLINPDAANPAPGQWWTDNAIPATDARRQHVFTFGAIPTPGGQNPNYALNAYGPAPGTGGGPNPTDGTPDPLHIFPVTTTGAAGTNISLVPGKPGTQITMQDGTGTLETFAAHADIFFHETNVPPAKYTVQLPVDCGLDTYPETGATCPAQCSITVPSPGYCTTRPSPAVPQGIPTGCYTSDQSPAPAAAQPGIRIPIVTPAPRVETALNGNFFSLSNSDGTTWQDMVNSPDCATGTEVSCPKVLESPTGNQSVALRANADLFTDTSGYNQDIGIFVSDNGGADTLLAWKESGGSAGIFSPNAAYVQALFPETGGHKYVYKLKWKTSKPASGVTIYAGAGAGSTFPTRSHTSLTVEDYPATNTPVLANKANFSSLASSDGVTWQLMDPSLTTTLSPVANSTALLGANADLFTDTSGYNQDIGIFVTDNGGPATLIAWKESGGSAGIFSPNAAYVKEIYPMTAGHTYVFSVQWKTNKPASGVTIYAGAGSGSGLPGRSPTSLIAETLAAGANPYNFTKGNFSSLASSDGVTWQPMDAALTLTVPGSDNMYAHLGANADLFTDTSGYNQDIGLFVQDGTGTDTLVAWKESGGSAGIFSPNAAYVQHTLPLAAGHTYTVRLKWKTSKPASGVTIYAGAGSGSALPSRSPTTLVAQVTN